MKNSLLLKQKNLGLVAWSPFKDDPFLLARGSLLEVPEDSVHTEEIELLRIDPLRISEPNPLISMGRLETGVTLNCLDWSAGFLEETQKGIISGAFGDGSLVLLDAQKLLESQAQSENGVLEDEDSDDPALLSTFTLYESQEFYCMEYNAFKPHLLATGGSDIYIVNFERSLDEPEVFSPYPLGTDLLKGSKVTSICWNKNKGVQHILASACDDGRVSIFDLKTKKSIFSLSDQKEHVRGRNVSIQWNSSIATQLGIAFDDEASGVQIWDLRNPKSPVKILDRDIVSKVHSLGWQTKDRMLLCDYEGVVRTYNNSSDSYEELYRPEPQSVPVVKKEENALDVFNNLGDEDVGEQQDARWLYAKSIPSIKNSFFSVNDSGNLIARFGDREEVSSLASKFLDCDVNSGWKRGVNLNAGSLLVPTEIQVQGLEDDFTNPDGQNLVKISNEMPVESLSLDSDEMQLMDRIRETAEDWEAYLAQKNETGKKALKERLRKKGLDTVLLDLIEMVGSTWKEKLPVLGMDVDKTISKTEKVTGYKYSKGNDDEQDPLNQDGNNNTANANEAICEFADISENEAEDFFTQLAKKNEKPESKAEKSIISDKNIGVGVYDSVQEMDMEREVIMRNRDWNKGLEQLIKQNILVDNFEGAIDCAVKANRYFEGFLIAFSHPQNSQALLQKTLDKVSQRHSEDFIHGFLKPMFKKDYKGIIEKYPLEDWQEALAFIVHNLEDSQSQSDCLEILRKRVQEAVNQPNLDPNRSEKNTHRRETVSQKVSLPSETLLYLDLFQNDINNTVNHLLDQLDSLTSENVQHLVNVFEYLLFIRDSQSVNLENEKLQALLLEFSNLMLLSGAPVMAFYLLETLGKSSNYHVQTKKHLIWTGYSSVLTQHFSAPLNPVQPVVFPRLSIFRKTVSPPVSTTNRRKPKLKPKPNPKPFGTSRAKPSPFGNSSMFAKPTPLQPPPSSRRPKPPTNPTIRPSKPVPTTKPFVNPSSNRMAPPPRPTNVLKKNRPRPPPRTNPIPKPPVSAPQPAPPSMISRPPTSTLMKKTVPTKPNVVKPPPPRRPLASNKPPGPPSKRNII